MCSESPPSSLASADRPAVIAHLNMLQAIIARLAGQSASSKTWCLTLVGGLLGLASATKTPGLLTLGLVPVAAFAFLDAMYLAHERAFRDHFGGVVAKLRSNTYALEDVFDTRAEAPDVFAWLSALVSWATLPLYLGLVLGYLAADRVGLLGALARGG